MIEAMRHGVVPATLHVDTPNPQIDWADASVELLTRSRPWPESNHPRRAAVHSFAISGLNAHVILEQAPALETAAEPVPDSVVPSIGSRVLPWLLSARSPEALAGQARRLADFVRDRSDVDAGRVARALARRSVFEHRAVVLGGDRAELVRGLDALLADTPTGRAREEKTAFAFLGAATPSLGLGRASYEMFPVFREAFDAVATLADQHLRRPLREVLWGEDAEELSRPCYLWSGLFAVELALFALLDSFGVRPDLVLGHSVGEIAAAHVAGVLSLPDALALVLARARLTTQESDTTLPEFASVADTVSAAAPRIPIVSGLDGLIGVDGAGYGDGDYWLRQVRATAPLGDTLDAVTALHPTARFVWVGPGGAEPRSVVEALAEWHVAGTTVDWSPLLGPARPLDIDLPTYAFAHRHYWLDPVVPAGGAEPGRRPAVAPVAAEFEEFEEFDLVAELVALNEQDRRDRVSQVVLEEMAAVLGHADITEIEPEARFTELGFDSLSAVEFRNGLVAVTGMRIPPTMVFDYATPAELIDFITRELLSLLEDAVA
jgi:acyl transferase domain-containing protein